MVTLHTTFGDIKLRMYADEAPATVENFLQYCRDGFYNGTLFHRVIDGFMVQGGGMASGMEEKSTRAPIKNEADNGLSNLTGRLSMARTMEPHSASSQFFINVNDNLFLDHKAKTPDGWGYCVFAEVIDGMDVVNKIKGVATGNWGYVHQDVPVEEVLINSVTIED
ncbi:peptidylprolyl isomerase [Salinivibrio sp. IB643]|uniref:peptidylprolyl isomerase n=1 Tax=Salinivibrio sp. IB643 TaxID=1909445 RepID=UPI00098921F5|nr:peptidylprolyl isomerase [Salinivibrio sp. IB643]OOE99259.1 peptidylprolyl isomerase [Salinivibrio sp. IB643]